MLEPLRLSVINEPYHGFLGVANPNCHIDSKCYRRLTPLGMVRMKRDLPKPAGPMLWPADHALPNLASPQQDMNSAMALPVEINTDKVATISEALGKMSGAEIAALPDLEGTDLRCFGRLIQCFCFIDLNLRRAIEVFELAGKLPEKWKKDYPKFPDGALTEVLSDIVRTLDPNSEPIEVTITWLTAISKFRGFRNLAGHAAAKRYPNEDVYVFANKNSADAKKAGQSLPKHGLMLSVVGRSEFFDMTQAAVDGQKWLSEKLTAWSAAYPAQNAATAG